MSASSSGFMKFFNAITFTRQLVLNVLFLGFIAFFLLIVTLLMTAGDDKLTIAPKTTLMLDLDGAIVEDFTKAPWDRALSVAMGQEVKDELRLYDLLKALQQAQKDDNITQVYLRFGSDFEGGMAQMRELGEELEKTKQAGKRIVSFSENYDQKQYLLASVADRVYLDPEGMVMLEGLSRYRQYFRRGLEEKLGMNVHLFKVGTFKSAAEPFIRDDASPESKEADLYWMNDIWARYLNEVGRRRNIQPAVLQANINNMSQEVTSANGNMGFLAMRQRLVDGLLTEELVERDLIKHGKEADNDKSVAKIDFNRYIEMNGPTLPSQQRVAVVVTQGSIVNGDEEERDSVVGGATAKRLREVRHDASVKAVVLRVDSPGGAVFASEQIRREVELIQKTGRPVVVSMGNMAASGGYWISMNADSIVADPSTITGSIGIFGLIPDVSGTLDKIGVSTDGVGTTKMAGAFDVGRSLSPEVKQVIQQMINHGYVQFINKVARGRDMTVQQVDRVAQGRVWSGHQAKNLGLVDELGGLQFAIDRAKQLAKVPNAQVTFSEGKVPRLAELFLSTQRSALLKSLMPKDTATFVAWQVTRNRPELKMVERMIKEGPQAYAHCLCDIK